MLVFVFVLGLLRSGILLLRVFALENLENQIVIIIVIAVVIASRARIYDYFEKCTLCFYLVDKDLLKNSPQAL